MASAKREVATKNCSFDKFIVYTNDKGNEFVSVVLNYGSKKLYLMDFKNNDALLLEIYKEERVK